MAEYDILSRLPVKGATEISEGALDSGKVPILDNSGKLHASVIPASGVFSVFNPADQAARLALTAEVGDIAKQEDTQRSYVLQQLPASVDGHWLSITPELVSLPYAYATNNTLLKAGGSYIADTTGGVMQLTLPDSPIAGDVIKIIDPSTSWGVNNLTLLRNGKKINSASENLVADVSAYITLIFLDEVIGWRVLPNATFETFNLPRSSQLVQTDVPTNPTTSLAVPYTAGTQYYALGPAAIYFYTGNGVSHSWLKIIGATSF